MGLNDLCGVSDIAHGNEGGLYLDIGDGVVHALPQRLVHTEEGGREGGRRGEKRLLNNKTHTFEKDNGATQHKSQSSHVSTKLPT